MKCSFFKLFLMFGGLASSLCTVALGQHTGCGEYGPQPAGCPYRAAVETAAAPAMSPWGLPTWLSAKPTIDVPPADGAPEVYQGCEAGLPVDSYGCAAAQSPSYRDVWSEIYLRDCCPVAVQQAALPKAPEAVDLAADAVTEPADVSELGCLAADERHSQGQSAVESLNQQQQGLSGTHLTVRLRVGPVAEDDEIVAAPTVEATAPTHVSPQCFDDEESCMRLHYEALGADCCLDEYDCYCHPRAAATDECEVATDDCEYAAAEYDAAAEDCEYAADDCEVAAEDCESSVAEECDFGFAWDCDEGCDVAGDDCEEDVVADDESSVDADEDCEMAVDCEDDCEFDLELEEAAPAVANRAVIESDPQARDFQAEALEAILTEEPPLCPEITRQDLVETSLPASQPWANDAIRQADGRAMCRGMLNGWAFAARYTGECLRSLSHTLSELADDLGEESYAQEEEYVEPANDCLDDDETVSQSIPEEYLGW
ncbi:MAG: hypothetical protein AB7O62_01430 [Pirellulales bacterium]